MAKKKDKEYYYRFTIKRDLIISIIFTIVATVFLFVVSGLMNKNNNFEEKGIKTKAVITDIKYRSEIKKEDIQSVYVSYVVNGKKYNSILNQTNSSMYEGKELEIYYNPDNPKEIVFDDSSLFLFKGFVYIMLTIGILSIIISLKKIVRYYTSLNGREVEAEIVDIIEKNVLGRKNFIVQCKWIDEKGTEHIFNSLPFDAPYFIEEFSKMEINKLKVRFNENNVSKYVVFTEKIDRLLNK